MDFTANVVDELIKKDGSSARRSLGWRWRSADFFRTGLLISPVLMSLFIKT